MNITKNKVCAHLCGYITVLLACIAAFAFFFSACENGSNEQKTLTHITLDTEAVQKDYQQGEALNLSGLVVTAVYSDSSSETVTGYTTTPANGATLSVTGDTTVTVSYTEGSVTESATFTVNAVTPGKALTGITLDTEAVQKSYQQGEELNLSGLVVTAVYSDSSSETVTGYTTTPANGATLSVTGDTTVTVSYTEGGVTESATFTVNAVTPGKTLTGITLNTEAVQKSYQQGETLNLSGLVVTAVYSDSSSETVTGYTTTPANGATLSVTGDTTVSVNYTEGSVTESATFTVNAGTAGKTLTSIVLNTDEVQKVYQQGEELNLSGLVVTAVYSDSSSETVTGYTTTPTNGATLSAAGETTVTVSYTEGSVTESAAFTVNAVTPGKTLTGITLNTEAVQKSYQQGEELNLSGLVVTAVYSDASSEAVTGYTTTPANGATLSAAEETTVIVSYTESGVTRTGSFTVTVAGTVASISGMAWIPAGTFTMGSPTDEPGRYSDETQRQVTLSQGFYMGIYPVTQGQYEAVMGSNPSSDYGVGNDYPVYYVSWYDALVFCNKLSVMEGLTPAYSINGSTDTSSWGSVPTSSNATWNAVTIVAGSTGYRLPTEAQWEYACRAGTTAAFDWGTNTISSAQANFAASSVDAVNLTAGTYLGRTSVVGSYAPNAWGLYDMRGNVWEWCWDWYGTYASGTQTDPTGTSSGAGRVLRGGSWYNLGQYLRSAARVDYGPSAQNNGRGFRLVRP